MTVRVLIVDDHEVVRTGLASLFTDTDIEVVGQAARGEDAVQLVDELSPDVVLLDIRMPEGDGLQALEQIHQQSPETRVVMLSTYDNPTYMARAQALGASDYLLKGSSRENFMATIHAVAQGTIPSPHGELHRVAKQMAAREADSDTGVALTQRETQVLRHLALGLSNKEIGQSLSISIETVKEHVQNVLRKIEVTDRTQAAVWAVRRNLV